MAEITKEDLENYFNLEKELEDLKDRICRRIEEVTYTRRVYSFFNSNEFTRYSYGDEYEDSYHSEIETYLLYASDEEVVAYHQEKDAKARAEKFAALKRHAEQAEAKERKLFEELKAKFEGKGQ